MPIDLNVHAGATDAMQFSQSLEGIDLDAIRLNKVSPISQRLGLESISEYNEAFPVNTHNDKAVLQQPTVAFEQMADEVIELSPEVAAKLGTLQQITQAELFKLCLDRINKMQGDMGQIALDSESLEYLCILLTLEPKSKLIATLQATLHLKITERQVAHEQQLIQQEKEAKERVELEEQQKKAARRAKIFGWVFKAVAVCVAVVTTVATCGAAGAASIAGVAAIISCTLTVGSTVLDVAGSVVTDGSAAKGLQIACFAVGIAACVTGLVSGGFTAKLGAKLAESTATNLQKTITHVSYVAQYVNAMAQGGSSIMKGVEQYNLAKSEKALADIEIDIEKLTRLIAMVSQNVEQMSNVVMEFLKNILQDEENAAQSMNQNLDMQMQMASKMC